MLSCLPNTSDTPAAAAASSSASFTCPETMAMRNPGRSACTACASSTPLMPGMLWSVTHRSTGSRLTRNQARASSPDRKVLTRYPCLRSSRPARNTSAS